MAKKKYICQGGYLADEKGKLTEVSKGTEVTIEEKVGDKCRFLKPVKAGKKLVVNTPDQES